ncbi:MAG TPA: disulfide bond formation protein B [Gammaproteobacteria bacterium]
MILSRFDRCRWNLLGAGICIGLLAYAYYAQYIQGYAPCPLCIFQRVALFPLAAVFVVAGIHNPFGNRARVYAVLGVVAALLGAFTSGWHVYVQYTPNPPACLASLEIVMQANPFFDALIRVFQNAGDCTEIDWSFLGLSMPIWVFFWFVALGALAVYANWKKLTADRFG